MTEIQFETEIGSAFGFSWLLPVLVIITAVIAVGALLYDRNRRKRR